MLRLFCCRKKLQPNKPKYREDIDAAQEEVRAKVNFDNRSCQLSFTQIFSVFLSSIRKLSCDCILLFCSFFICIFAKVCDQAASNLWKEITSAFDVFAWLNPHVSLLYSLNMEGSIKSGDFPAHFENQSLFYFSNCGCFICFVAVYTSEAAVHHVNSWCTWFLKWTKKAFSHIAVCPMEESDSPSGYETGFNPFIPIIHLALERHFILPNRN